MYSIENDNGDAFIWHVAKKSVTTEQPGGGYLPPHPGWESNGCVIIPLFLVQTGSVL